MKTLQLTILLLIAPLTFFAQSLTGLWMGTVSNDSTTVRKDQSYELVLTQYKNKVYGYSRSTFIVNDTLFYVVKRVKGSVEGDVCEIKDDEIVSYNFRGRIDKGVKMISTFHFDDQDSVWKMDGNWKTNQTKKYYSVTGKMDLKTEKDPEKSKIIPHLEELKLTDDIAFYQENKKKQEAATVINQPVRNTPPKEPVKEVKPPAASAREVNKEEIAKAPVKKESEIIASSVKASKKDIAAKEENITDALQAIKKNEVTVAPAKTEPATVKAAPAQENKKENTSADIAAKEVVKQETKRTEPVEQKKEIVAEPVKAEVKKEEIITAVGVQKEKQTVIIKPQEIKPAVSAAAALIAERKIAAPQIVFFKSDSLELSLYDNGEVDGDTVSVLFNGELILAKQGLKASAIKKTIYVPAGQMDSLTLVLYAENLGKYPPNTGLLVVHDGDDVYQVRFSADLKQNAAVIFQRKPR